MNDDRHFSAVVMARVAEAIGGRAQAAEFERRSGLRFKRKTLQSWIDGVTAPDLFDLDALAGMTGQTVPWFLGIDAASDASAGSAVQVPVVPEQAAAGAGRFPSEARAVEAFPFPREFILRLGGEPSRVSALRAVGSSMLPTIGDGALLLMDGSKDLSDVPMAQKRSRKTPRRPQPADNIYVFFQADTLRLKRLRWLDERYMAAISDNIVEHPPEIFEAGGADAIKVIGRVIWWDNRL